MAKITIMSVLLVKRFPFNGRNIYFAIEVHNYFIQYLCLATVGTKDSKFGHVQITFFR